MTESFTELAKRDQTIVPDRAGTPVDIATADHELLIDVFLFLKEREARFKEMRTQVEDELVRRHGDRRAAQPVGEFEVDVDRGFSRVWDPDDLDPVVQELFRQGKVSASDLTGLLKLETKVDGRKAQALLNRVDGDALVELRRCFTWQQRGRAKVKVTPVASLEPPTA